MPICLSKAMVPKQILLTFKAVFFSFTFWIIDNTYVNAFKAIRLFLDPKNSILFL
jgi:hypothetical protein